MVEFSREYSDKVGPSLHWYPDTNVGAKSEEYDKFTVADTGGTNRTLIGPPNANYNHGFKQRKELLTALTEVDVLYPLNRFGFIEAFVDRILPNGKLVLDFTLESDDNVIFRATGDAGRYVITKMVLWIPKMVLNVAGERILLEKYLTNESWSYLTERVEVSPVLQVRQGTFRITSGIQSPKHLFIWFLNDGKLDDQEKNMFVYDTYKISTASSTITDCQVEVNSGTYFPQVRLNPTEEMGRAYRMLIEYTKAFNDRCSAPLIDIGNFQELFGFLYFDLSGEEDGLRNESVKLNFRFTLDKQPTSQFNIYALILHEQTMSVDVTSGRAILRT